MFSRANVAFSIFFFEGGKLDNFLQEAGKSTMTIYMLSFPSKMKKEMISFLSSNAATDLINNYAARNIRGYGFARVETSAAALENDTADFAEVLKVVFLYLELNHLCHIIF